MNLIEAIKQAMFPVGSLMAFKSGFTPPTGWQEIEDFGLPYENASTNGIIKVHSHNIESLQIGVRQLKLGITHGASRVIRTDDENADDYIGLRTPYDFRGATNNVGEQYNKPFGFEAKWFIWDPDKVNQEKYHLFNYLKEKNLSVDEWLEMPSES